MSLDKVLNNSLVTMAFIFTAMISVAIDRDWNYKEYIDIETIEAKIVMAKELCKSINSTQVSFNKYSVKCEIGLVLEFGKEY